MPVLGPRLVVAGTHSGVGKTTVATGLMAALRRRGVSVASAKVGPDFIDPGYHALATGRKGRNLDPWMCGTEAIGPLAGRAGAGADVLVVEGVMGLFDGAADRSGSAGPGRGPAADAVVAPVASTAQVAALLEAPVVLVVDASAMSGSVAALVHGFSTFDAAIRVAAVVLNRVGSDSHEDMLRTALSPLGVPVLGVLRRDDALSWRDRHLGLVPVAEDPAAVTEALDRLADAVDRGCQLDQLLALASSAPTTPVAPAPEARPTGSARVAVLDGRAFSFTYPDNLELLTQAGAELVPVDPEVDRCLPEGIGALYAGGGFPEVFAPALAANRPLLDDIHFRVGAGLAAWAECGGLLWLARSLDGHPMAGVVPADARMTARLALGYRRARTRVETPLGPAGTVLRGHEFHYSAVDPGGDALDWHGREGPGRGGFASPALLASYLHLHLAADPSLAERFVAAAGDNRAVQA